MICFVRGYRAAHVNGLDSATIGQVRRRRTNIVCNRFIYDVQSFIAPRQVGVALPPTHKFIFERISVARMTAKQKRQTHRAPTHNP
jgi:hypothetical protein